jgi:Glycosyl hydrolase family 115/Gylcosyl hydrolase family 115 C-terminal domain
MKTLLVAISFLFTAELLAQKELHPGVNLGACTIYVDDNDDAVVKKAASLLQQDIEAVTGYKPAIISKIDKPYKHLVVAGTVSKSSFIKELVKKKMLKLSGLKDKWEGYQLQTVEGSPKMMPMGQLLVIAGSDRRGAAYGMFEIAKRIGVSPWYWWADVPVKKQNTLFIHLPKAETDAPKVKYRGIFINDEAPALSNWSKEKFGGFNHLFYEKVFELMLRLKANYLWPAMWGNAFYDDDSLNIKSADEYAIVIGTSHHEPLMRAHDEWRRYGNKKKWNYDSTESGLKEFWQKGMQRAWNEKIVSVGMRGDGDEPMSRETATALLERIVKDQREIIADVAKKPADQTPQLWALYKEVQDYYDKGMRVPDDVTLLLCDDNWGNIRKLPRLDEKPRKGGYGIYYHFDYVGGPRNYKWINTNPLPRIWEQMHLAWEYNARQIWIVNVGDIKPMELPISFWCDYAWNPERIDAADIKAWTENWAAQQFGNTYAKEIAGFLSLYGKYNARRKPELLDANTFDSKNSDEFERVKRAYVQLTEQAKSISARLDAEYRDAYFQLVMHPVSAMANLYEMYLNVARNRQTQPYGYAEANMYADKVKELYKNDSLITLAYHQLKNGKWNHMMSQTHIGYTYWQQPPVQRMPAVKYVPADSIREVPSADVIFPGQASVPPEVKGNIFYEQQYSGVSMEAAHYTSAVNTKEISWKLLPDLGRTGDAVTTFPVTAPAQKPGGNAPHLQYEIYTQHSGDCSLNLYFSPTLNFHNTPEGLQYAVSVNDETPQIISINKEDKNSISGIWNKWVSENIIIKTSKHKIDKPGKHIVKYWMVNSGVVLQKLVLDFGKPSPMYLGPPETRIIR